LESSTRVFLRGHIVNPQQFINADIDGSKHMNVVSRNKFNEDILNIKILLKNSIIYESLDIFLNLFFHCKDAGYSSMRMQ